MPLYWLILVLFSFFAIKDWKNTTVVWLPLQLLFNECICLRYESPSLSLVLGVDFMLFFIYLMKKGKMQTEHEEFFFKKVFVIYFVSYMLSMLFSIVPIGEVLTGTIKFFVQNFLILFLFQKALTGIKEVRLFVKTIFIVAILITGLGLFESVVKDNPVLDYVFLNAPLDAIKGKLYYTPPFLSVSGEMDQRFGMVRAFSFFSIHIAFGCACVMLFFFYVYLYKMREDISNRLMIIIGIMSFLIGVFLSNSKTPIVGLVFLGFGLLSMKDVFKWQIVVFVIAGVVVMFTYYPEYLNNFTALFDSSVAEEGGGSNMNMRIRQFEVGFDLFARSPLFGNGVGALAMLDKVGNNSDILGAESSWLKILPERGLMGVVAYIYLYFAMYGKLRPFINKKVLLCFLWGLLAMETASGFMNMAIFGSIVIALYRIVILKRNGQLSVNTRFYPNE